MKTPKMLSAYLDAKNKKPMDGFINASTYYTQLDYYWINYMQYIVRPCIAYGSGVLDLSINSTLQSGIGKAIVDGATRLTIGDKTYFEGNDTTCRFFSDVWKDSVSFDSFLLNSQRYKYLAGTCVCKLNIDEYGRCIPMAVRLDRALPTVDDCGKLTGCVFFISLITNTNRGKESDREYWIVEDRHYNENGEKVVIYKVFSKQGIAGSPVLPTPYQQGIPYDNLPGYVRKAVERMGIKTLNQEITLPFRDGLGMWLLNRTTSNSYVPDAPFGDPLLAGIMDLLWSIDLVYCGSIVDVLIGEGKIIVPKMFLQETLKKLQSQYPGTDFTVTTGELNNYEDDTFVYIMPSGFDKEKQSPIPIQFDIRADQYTKMWELYQKSAISQAGFAPSSIFPHLTPDGSSKTAEEVRAEENLTTASVRQAHIQDVPVYNKILREVAWLEGFPDNVGIKLSDYVGNKIKADELTRANYQAGLMPKEEAVQRVNNLSISETKEYMEKIKKDQEEEKMFNPSDYFGEETNGIRQDEKPIFDISGIGRN